ncbi:hypothetical protein ACSBR1_026402 [Camellia fascicularis]
MALNSPLGYSKRAYVTFLAGNGDFVKGVIALAKCLRKVKSAYPLVVVILPDVPEDHRKILTCQGCVVREMEAVHPPEREIEFESPYYELWYSKLSIWKLEEYNKMIYLDADVLVMDNIDHLFDLPDGYFYAVSDCFCEWSHSSQYLIGYCQQCPDKVTWPPEMGSPPPLYFNAGMFMFEPCHVTYQNLLKALHITPPGPFADQDLLNKFFRHKFKPIPVVYNLVLPILWCHPENVELEKVKVVHFCATGAKPWKYTGKEDNMQREDVKMLIAKWWNVYNDELLN